MSRERFYLLQHVHIYILHVRKCMRVFLTCITHAPRVETSNAEPPVSPACCFTRKPRCASALLQLHSIFHSNPRDWELKARWTFFNNEGILCLQFSAWLTRAVWPALQSVRRHSLSFAQQQSALIIAAFSLVFTSEAGRCWVGAIKYLVKEADWLIAAVQTQVAPHCYSTVATRVAIITLQFISGHRGQISLPVFSSALLQGWRHAVLH